MKAQDGLAALAAISGTTKGLIGHPEPVSVAARYGPEGRNR
jgi:hypothetical protein